MTPPIPFNKPTPSRAAFRLTDLIMFFLQIFFIVAFTVFFFQILNLPIKVAIILGVIFGLGLLWIIIFFIFPSSEEKET